MILLSVMSTVSKLEMYIVYRREGLDIKDLFHKFLLIIDFSELQKVTRHSKDK